MIDPDGLRRSIGIILVNNQKRLLWARRLGKNAWQFPQGGLNSGETEEEAMFRELYEETGLRKPSVQILGSSQKCLTYKLPKSMIRYDSLPLCIGQTQKWFLLEFLGVDSDICLDVAPKAEFDQWRWVSYWYPLRAVIDFKKHVYRKALQEFAPIVFKDREKHSSTIVNM